MSKDQRAAAVADAGKITQLPLLREPQLPLLREPQLPQQQEPQRQPCESGVYG